jgi:hypothetical protein
MQIKNVFNCFNMISSALGPDESLTYADHLLAPLYKVSEGFAGKVVSGMLIFLSWYCSLFVFSISEVCRQVQCLGLAICLSTVLLLWFQMK